MPATNQPQQSGFDNSKLYVWVKGLESKVNNLLREMDILKNDFIKKNNNLKKEVKTLSGDFLEFKREQNKISEKMDLIIKELKQTAGIEEVTTLKKYLEFWNPMNFVTQRDLERSVDSKMALLKEELKQKHKIVHHQDHKKHK